MDRSLSTKAQETPHRPETWHVGDWAEIRPLGEIVATLDKSSALDGMPFMPEMVPFCGQRFQVWKVAHKTCDSSGWQYLRELKDAVHLRLRCSGASHGGCQAQCLFFWKTAWLKKVDGPLFDIESQRTKKILPISTDILERAATARNEKGNLCWRCQATEIKNAASPLKPWALAHYLRDLSSHNVSLTLFVRYAFLAFLKTLKIILLPPKPVPVPESDAAQSLDLQPGDLVRIKSRLEIMATLNQSRKNFGLSFDPDMQQYCGTIQKVVDRVERIIDEKTGKMLHFAKPCFSLQSVTCTGLNCRMRLFCPRNAVTFWRESWLEKIPKT